MLLFVWEHPDQLLLKRRPLGPRPLGHLERVWDLSLLLFQEHTLRRLLHGGVSLNWTLRFLYY